ncbi:NAD(P)/FAD-dependent oxidoreductase [Nocardia gamkensis]|uniref:FAD-dependent oxidoreductase n=1 Tax=Nocardia gamkensis TaxID=352869 RepID=A0A7X6L0U1_9NOCA|nr:FAD-dependent oxidoreductase [Nocardia gamkensis]NKY25782.1 FAD-dependent oxidoreductase [Nocardia gamkensis]NQE69032.1 Benzene 1,2-dioxygenase system ferredoxin--NAD(+) reductase subunit [Nocardia gamkensis]
MTVPPRGRVVILGTGVAGATAAETLRKQGFAGSIVLVGNDPAVPYRRPMVSKELLSGAVGEEKARLKPAAFWSEMTIELSTGVSARALDTTSARVEFDDGSDLSYDALILATGGRPRRLDSLLPGAHTLRHLHDVTPLRSAFDRAGATGAAPSVLVVGGGLVGMEAAATARTAGAEVTVLEMSNRVLERVVPEPISASYQRMHRDRGVAVETGVRLAAAAEENGRTRVVAEDGREWVADAVIAAVGMAPNTELAERVGLTVDDGIIVDQFCATSAPGVYAAGDVARLPNRILGGTERIEHWNHAQAHGAAAARTILGERVPYEEVPWCWTNQFGRNLQIAGWPGRGTELIVRGDVDAGPFLALSLAEDRLVGVIGVGKPRDVKAAQTLIKKGPYLPRAVLDRDEFDLVGLASTPERFTVDAATAVAAE